MCRGDPAWSLALIRLKLDLHLKQQWSVSWVFLYCCAALCSVAVTWKHPQHTHRGSSVLQDIVLSLHRQASRLGCPRPFSCRLASPVDLLTPQCCCERWLINQWIILNLESHLIYSWAVQFGGQWSRSDLRPGLYCRLNIALWKNLGHQATCSIQEQEGNYWRRAWIRARRDAEKIRRVFKGISCVNKKEQKTHWLKTLL